MRDYNISIPFKGSVSVTVTAKSLEDAVELALNWANIEGEDGYTVDNVEFQEDVDVEY